MRPFGLGALLLLAASLAFGQAADVAMRVYSASQDSIFLIYLNDNTGSPKAFGSAFLVAPRTLVTNAHVVDGGIPVLAIGPVRIPLKVLRIDSKNDLAVLSVDADLGSKALQLASMETEPGEQIFAIGNPEGLEKTISQGIVSGLRKRGNRDLIQITSPISHGSSGGPILNSKGEVVGVAVGMLDDGQNLNFAVPVVWVRAILENKSNDAPLSGVDESLSNIKDRLKELLAGEYSDDPSSKYQETIAKLLSSMQAIVDSTGRDDALTEVACSGTKVVALSDVGIAAARKLMRESPTTKHRALLSYVLYDRAEDEHSASIFSEKDSAIQLKAIAAHEQFLHDASREAVEVTKIARGQELLLADYILGNTKSDTGDYASAISLHSSIADLKPQVCGIDLVQPTLRNLINESVSAKRPDEAEKWFRRFASQYTPTAYDWDSEGDRRNSANDATLAALAYENAAAGLDYYGYDYCFATNLQVLKQIADNDGILADGRKCVEASVKNTIKSNQHYFDSTLPAVYRNMARVLNERGVYKSALEYIKESLASKPNEPFALDLEAGILEHLERYTECIAAEQSAIRESDGKYPWMQFQLGNCYFDT